MAVRIENPTSGNTSGCTLPATTGAPGFSPTIVTASGNVPIPAGAGNLKGRLAGGGAGGPGSANSGAGAVGGNGGSGLIVCEWLP